MSFTNRSYDDIVRDMLTTLTGGTVREGVTAPAGDVPIVLERLQQRPVRRVSHLEGVISVGAGANAREVPYRFTPADFELVSTTGDENARDSIRFRDGGRRPIPGSQLTVNYYPVQTDPTPLTDLNVGSVVRTLLETVAREMALTYQQLDHIYDSAFLETAEGSSLDKVVALVGARRLPAGVPVVRLRFSRRADVGSQVTVPANTAVTDAAGSRYLTLQAVTLEPGEATREVMARGETAGTPLVAANELNRPAVRIAGIAEVTNPQPAFSLNAPETDDDLRRRAPSVLQGAVRGTLDALRFSLLSIEEVKNVTLTEAPNGVPGEVRVEVAHTGGPEVDEQIARTIEAVRPAGIRVLWGQAGSTRVDVQVALTFAGATLPGATIVSITAAVEAKLRSYLTGVPPGGRARRAQMLKLALDDTRITDAAIGLVPSGGESQEEIELAPGTIFEVGTVTFAPPVFEEAGTAAAAVATVTALLPVHLVAGVTLAQATSAITPALDSYLASRSASAPLDVDGLAAAIRDDSRFALVRADVIVTVEGGGRFLQLTDGTGAYAPAPNERLQKGEVTIDPREGGL